MASSKRFGAPDLRFRKPRVSACVAISRGETKGRREPEENQERLRCAFLDNTPADECAAKRVGSIAKDRGLLCGQRGVHVAQGDAEHECVPRPLVCLVGGTRRGLSFKGARHAIELQHGGCKAVPCGLLIRPDPHRIVQARQLLGHSRRDLCASPFGRRHAPSRSQWIRHCPLRSRSPRQPRSSTARQASFSRRASTLFHKVATNLRIVADLASNYFLQDYHLARCAFQARQLQTSRQAFNPPYGSGGPVISWHPRLPRSVCVALKWYSSSKNLLCDQQKGRRMSIGMVISSIALTVSLLVTIIKFIDWISHSDPCAIVRLGRFGLLVLAVASVPSADDACSRFRNGRARCCSARGHAACLRADQLAHACPTRPLPSDVGGRRSAWPDRNALYRATGAGCGPGAPGRDRAPGLSHPCRPARCRCPHPRARQERGIRGRSRTAVR